MRVQFHPEAAHDFTKSLLYYKKIDVAIAESFRRDFDESLELISNFVEIGAANEESAVKKTLLKVFPFCIYYRNKGELIEIIAIAHQKRDPNYWLDR